MTDTPAAIAAVIASSVRQRRRELHWTLNDLARVSGIARATLHGIEMGRAKRMSVGTLLRLAEALGQPPDALLGRDLSRVPFTPQEVALVIAHRRIFGAPP